MLRRHVVLVLVDQLDMAAARALQYARTLHPDDLRAVHFALDNRVAADLEADGAASASPGCLSTSTSARTAGSPGPPSSWPPRRWPTGRPS